MVKYTQIKGVSNPRLNLGVLKSKVKFKFLIELEFMMNLSYVKSLIKNYDVIVINI